MTAAPIAGRAAIGDGNGGFTISEVVTAPPGLGEVRVRMRAAGICHTDHASLRWPGPLVLGHEGAGEIEAVGDDIDGLEPGQNVLLNWAIPCHACAACARGDAALCERTHEIDPDRLGTSRAHSGHTLWHGTAVERSFHLGTFADYTLVRAAAVTPLPAGLAPDPACILGCAVMTGVGSAVTIAAVRPGDSVAVVGLGGVGLNVVQGARLAGATTIVAIDKRQASLDRAISFGATHTVLVQQDDADHATLIAEVMRLSDRRGVDHAFEATGVPELAFLPLRLVRNGGTALQVSGAHGESTVTLPRFFWNKRYIVPLYGGCLPSRDFPRLFGWISEGALEVEALITNRYPLEDLDEAIDDMLAGRSAKGVLTLA